VASIRTRDKLNRGKRNRRRQGEVGRRGNRERRREIRWAEVVLRGKRVKEEAGSCRERNDGKGKGQKEAG
jgi:hypothetical protein